MKFANPRVLKSQIISRAPGRVPLAVWKALPLSPTTKSVPKVWSRTTASRTSSVMSATSQPYGIWMRVFCPDDSPPWFGGVKSKLHSNDQQTPLSLHVVPLWIRGLSGPRTAGGGDAVSSMAFFLGSGRRLSRRSSRRLLRRLRLRRGEDYILGETLAQVEDIHLYMIGYQIMCIYICVCVCACVSEITQKVSVSNIITYSQYKSALLIITYCTILS